MISDGTCISSMGQSTFSRLKVVGHKKQEQIEMTEEKKIDDENSL